MVCEPRFIAIPIFQTLVTVTLAAPRRARRIQGGL
jgi:hypothetical protein